MYDELRSICDEHGVFLRGEAIALGYTDRTLARALRARVIHRIRHGSYTYTDRWEALSPTGQHRLAAMAVLRTAKAEVVLSHTTALVLHDVPMWDLSLEVVHVTRLDRHGGRNEAGVKQHRGLLVSSDLVDLSGVPVTSPTRA